MGINKLYCSGLLFCLLFSPLVVADVSDLVINEVMARPVDAFGVTSQESGFVYQARFYVSDWIELYNPGNELVDVHDLYLTDNCLFKDKWQIKLCLTDGCGTTTQIPAGGFLVIYCPGYFLGCETDDEGNEICVPIPSDKAPFGLSGGGEWIGLYEKDGDEFKEIDSLEFPEQLSGKTFGCHPDGSKENRGYLTTPTYQLENAEIDDVPPQISVRSYRGVVSSEAGDTYSLLVAANQPVRVRAEVTDLLYEIGASQTPDITDVKLFYQVSGGGFQSLGMYTASDPRDAADGLYETLIPGQAEGSVVEFYVQAEDAGGKVSELYWSTLYNPNRDTPLGFHYPVGQVGEFATTIRLNEILADNEACPSGSMSADPSTACHKGGMDNRNNADDWVELVNDGEEPQEILQLYLTNNELDPTRFPLSDAIGRSPGLDDAYRLKSQDFLFLWCDNESDESEDNYIHVPFNLDANEDEVFLVAYRDQNDDGIPELFKMVDLVSWGSGNLRNNPEEPWFGPQDPDWSLGRFAQGEDALAWGRMEPTEGGTNPLGAENTGFVPSLTDITISPVAPLEGQTVTFTATVWDEKAGATVLLNYFSWATGNDYSKPMLDNGEEGDAAAGDGIYTAVINGQDDPQVAGKMDYSVTVEDADGNTVRFPRTSAIWGRFHIGALPNTSPGAGGPGHPVISEVLVSNRDCDCAVGCMCDENGEPLLPPGCELGGKDSFGEADDWLEIYNPHDYTIFLGDYFLSDDQEWTMQWAFPEVNLGPGERLIVWCDADMETQHSASEYHASFFLDKGGDQVYLLYQNTSSERQVVDFWSFGEQISDVVYGRAEDGDDMGFLMAPSMNGANSVLAAHVEAITEQADPADPLTPGSRIHLTGRALDRTEKIMVVPPFLDTVTGEVIYDDTRRGPEMAWDWSGAVEVSTSSWSVEEGIIAMTLPIQLAEGPKQLCVLSGDNALWHEGGVPWTGLVFQSGTGGPLPAFVRGDANQDGKHDLADAVTILSYLFTNGELLCLDSGDVNDDGKLDLADPVSLLSYLFNPEVVDLPAPFPDCGVDSTEDDLLDCVFESCQG